MHWQFEGLKYSYEDVMALGVLMSGFDIFHPGMVLLVVHTTLSCVRKLTHHCVHRQEQVRAAIHAYSEDMKADLAEKKGGTMLKTRFRSGKVGGYKGEMPPGMIETIDSRLCRDFPLMAAWYGVSVDCPLGGRTLE